MSSNIINFPRQGGFSLLELVLVIILVSLAAVPILGTFNQVGSAIVVNEEMQIATQLVQEQAEQLLADKRNLGYTTPSLIAGVTATAPLPAPYGLFDRTVTITDETSASLNGCPAAATCKLIQVDVNVAGGGRLLASTSFMVVQ